MKNTIKTGLVVLILCLTSGVIGWQIGDPDQYWQTWRFEPMPSANETMTLLIYEEDIISATHNGTRWEIEVKPLILYHINRRALGVKE
ncbi:MAG: hypothetical protein PHQ86_09270 [Dehalococcoidales bacterium]|nr:hypothetical protein [Dehalococcoidales bacterium]